MKVRVIKPFRDRYTKVIYTKGQEIDVTKERLEEINSAALGPFVEAVEEPEEVEATKKHGKPEKKTEKQPKTKTTKVKSR